MDLHAAMREMEQVSRTYKVPLGASSRDPEKVSWHEHQAKLLAGILAAVERIADALEAEND